MSNILDLMCLLGSNKDKLSFTEQHHQIGEENLLKLYKSLLPDSDYSKDLSGVSAYHVKYALIHHRSLTSKIALQLYRHEKNSELKRYLSEKFIILHPCYSEPNLLYKSLVHFSNFPESSLLFNRFLGLLVGWSCLVLCVCLGWSQPLFLWIGLSIKILLNIIWYASIGFTSAWFKRAINRISGLVLLLAITPLMFICLPIMAVLMIRSFIKGEDFFSDSYEKFY